MPKKTNATDPNAKKAVGYGSPPEEYKWKKGMKSPNPSGRPPSRAKKDLFGVLDPVSAVLIEHDKRLLSKNEGGKVVQVERGAAAVEKLYRLGMEGDLRAILEYLKMRDLAYDKKRELEEGLLCAAMKYQDYWLPHFRKAEHSSKPLPNQVPHPEDVVIHPDGSVDVVGPVTVQDQILLEKLLEERDELEASLKLAVGCYEPDKLEMIDDIFREKWLLFEAVIPPRLWKPFPSDEP